MFFIIARESCQFSTDRKDLILLCTIISALPIRTSLYAYNVGT